MEHLLTNTVCLQFLKHARAHTHRGTFLTNYTSQPSFQRWHTSHTYLICMEHTRQSLLHPEESMFQLALSPVSFQSSSGTVGHMPEIKDGGPRHKNSLKKSVFQTIYTTPELVLFLSINKD